jgi:hypothetical protein
MHKIADGAPASSAKNATTSLGLTVAKLFLEQGLELHAFVRQQHGFGLAPGIVDDSTTMSGPRPE